jgi:hypothetical protein
VRWTKRLRARRSIIRLAVEGVTSKFSARSEARCVPWVASTTSARTGAGDAFSQIGKAARRHRYQGAASGDEGIDQGRVVLACCWRHGGGRYGGEDTFIQPLLYSATSLWPDPVAERYPFPPAPMTQVSD